MQKRVIAVKFAAILSCFVLCAGFGAFSITAQAAFADSGSHTLTAATSALAGSDGSDYKADQLNKVQGEVSRLVTSWKLSGKTEAQKVKVIYDWVCKNVSYETNWNALESKRDYSMYTAYGALFNKRAVCEGYVDLFYKLCKQAGLDVLCIAGTAEGDNHIWNYVKVDGRYYNVDVTWDSQFGASGQYRWFLKTDADFRSDHIFTYQLSNITDTFGFKLGSITVPSNQRATSSFAYVKAKDATCTADGRVAHFTNGSSYYTNDLTKTNASAVKLAALGHSLGSWTVTRKATSTTAGSESRTCTRCGSTVETRQIAATPTKVAKPTAATGLVYNGKTQVGVKSSKAYKLYGVASDSKAGSHTVMARLNSGYRWNDGTADDVYVTWTIAAAKGSTATTSSSAGKAASSANTSGKSGSTSSAKSTSSGSASKASSTTVKKANTLKVSAKAKTITVKYNKKKATKIARAKAVVVSKAQGSVSYSKGSGSHAKIAVSKTGVITVPKALKKGKYKVKVAVRAAGNAKYKAATKTAAFFIQVK